LSQQNSRDNETHLPRLQAVAHLLNNTIPKSAHPSLSQQNSRDNETHLPRLQAVAHLLVVTQAQGEVLQQGAHECCSPKTCSSILSMYARLRARFCSRGRMKAAAPKPAVA